MTMLTALATALLAFTQDPTADAKTATSLMHADAPIVSSGVIDAPVAEVWQLFCTSKGAKKWMANEVEVDFRIGGSYRASYKEGSDLKGPDTIVNDILALDPYRMITIKSSKTPEKFPWKTAMSRCWTVIYFHDLDGKRTKLEIRMNGYDGSKESMEMKANFSKWNQEELDGIVKLFAKKG